MVVVIVELPQTPEVISEALEQRVEGRRVSYSWCVCVVSHGYGVLGAGINGVVDAGQNKGLGRMSGDSGAHTECQVKTLMTPDHSAVKVRSSG